MGGEGVDLKGVREEETHFREDSPPEGVELGPGLCTDTTLTRAGVF